MTKQSLVLVQIFGLILLSACNSMPDGAESRSEAGDDKPFLLNYPNLDDPDGRVVLSNDKVVLQRLVVPGGEWEGVHSHPGNQLYVHIRGGEWSGRLGGEIEYWGVDSPDGEIGWMDAIPLTAGHNSGNTGDSAIDLIYITLKSDKPIEPDLEASSQSYPDVASAVEFENHRIIAQRVHLAPGQWTGPHQRPGDQVYVVVKGGSWTERRSDGSASRPEIVEDGAVGWLESSDQSLGHDLGNTGDSTIEFVLVTIK